MNDDIIETFIKARKNKMLPVWCVLIAAGALASAIAIFAYLQLIGFLLALLAFVIAFLATMTLIKKNRLEYEISIVMGELTITEIRNQTWRKKVLCFDIRDIENFRKAKPEDEKAVSEMAKENQHKVLCCFGDEDEDIFFFNARDKEQGVTYDIFLAPDRRVMKEIASRSFDARRVLGNEPTFDEPRKSVEEE